MSGCALQFPGPLKQSPRSDADVAADAGPSADAGEPGQPQLDENF